VNPNFNRALLEDNDARPQDAQTIDSTDLSGQYHTEPYTGDHYAEAVPAEAVVDARYPAADAGWTVEQGGGEWGGYPERGTYAEENGGYQSLPRITGRPARAAEVPVPPPPPPPDPCEFKHFLCRVLLIGHYTLLSLLLSAI